MRKSVILLFLILIFAIGVGFGGWYYWSRPTLTEMVGQMIMTGFHGDGMGQNPDEFAAVSAQIANGEIGGVILFDVDVDGLSKSGMPMNQIREQIFTSNIKNMDQVRAMIQHLSSLSRNKLLVAVDQEGGTVQRLKSAHGFASAPSPSELGAGRASDTYLIAYDMGCRLSELGINVNFAPSLDVNVNPDSPIIGARGRSFSSNPDVVTAHGSAFARGMKDAGIAHSFKHFPGHGSAGTDSHMGLTDITDTYQESESIPWRELLSNASPLSMVMVAHVIDRNTDEVPASLSRPTVQQIRDLGFNGVIVSDDMDMGAIANEYGLRTAVRMAIEAGNDILVFGNNLTFDKNRGHDVNMMIQDMVRTGEISRNRIRQSYRRIMRTKRHMNNSRGNCK